MRTIPGKGLVTEMEAENYKALLCAELNEERRRIATITLKLDQLFESGKKLWNQLDAAREREQYLLNNIKQVEEATP